jgi:transaldolase
MKIFLDTANLDEIREGVALGLVDGVTTNPTLVAKERGNPEEIMREICRLVDGPISAEVIATDVDGMLREGRQWAAFHPNIVVKCPCTIDGLKATKVLASEGIRVNMTLIFSPTQALLAAKVGATFVSPFVGRLDDIATDGMELIREIIEIYRHYGFKTEVLVASVRHPMHVVAAARMGADICTCPAAVIESLFKHPLTDIGIDRFLKDWAAAKGAQQ